MAEPQVPSQTSDPWEDAAKQYNAARNPGPPSLIKVAQRASYAPKPVSDEEWKLWNAQSQDPEKPDFWGSLWGEIKNGPANLLGVGNAINTNVSDAVHGRMPRVIGQMGDAIAETGQKTKEAAQQGDYLGAARHAINTGINAVAPGLGSSSDEAGDMYARGEYGPATGKTLGMGVNTVIGLKTPQIMEGAANLPGKVQGAFRADPKVAITRAYRPTPSDPTFSDRIPDTVARVKAANDGMAPQGNDAAIPAIQRAIDNHKGIFNTWMDRAKGITIDGSPIIQATQDATKGFLPSEAGSAQALVDRAYQDYGTQFTPAQLKARLELLNERLDAHFSQAPGKQSAALADIPDAVLVAQRKAVADALYKALDPEGQGAGPRLIQQQTGDMIALKDAALRRKNAITAEQPVSTVGRVADAIKKVPKAVLPAKTGLSFSDSMQGNSDPLIRKAFKAVGEPNAAPRPGEPLYPTGDNTRLLGPPDVFTAPPADTSYVRSAPGMAQPPNASRALPAGPNVRFTAPPADTSGVSVTTGEPLRVPSSRQLPKGPTVRTPSDLSGQAGDITDLVPVQNPVTGRIEYIPRPQDPKDLPHYAKGGVIHKPTLLVDMASGKPSGVMAEKGPERIVPMGPPVLKSPGSEVKHLMKPENQKVENEMGKSGEDMIRGSSNIALSPKGVAQVEHLGSRFSQKGGVDKIVSSDLLRAKQTADAIHQHTGAPVVTTKGLRPWHLGEIEGQPTKKVLDRMNTYMTKKPDATVPGKGMYSGVPGESFNTFKRRTIGTLQKLLKEHAANPDAKIAAATHYRDVRLAQSWIKKGAPPSMEIDIKHMMGHGDSPGSVHRLFLAKGKPAIEPVDMAKPGKLKGGVYLTRHGVTALNAENHLPALKTPA